MKNIIIKIISITALVSIFSANAETQFSRVLPFKIKLSSKSDITETCFSKTKSLLSHESDLNISSYCSNLELIKSKNVEFCEEIKSEPVVHSNPITAFIIKNGLNYLDCQNNLDAVYYDYVSMFRIDARYEFMLKDRSNPDLSPSSLDYANNKVNEKFKNHIDYIDYIY